MSNDTAMNGQWLGAFGGSTPGRIVLNIDALDSMYEGVAFLFNDDANLPPTVAEFSIPEKAHRFEVRTRSLIALDPVTLLVIPREQIKEKFGPFSDYADVVGSLDDDSLTLRWKTEIGVEGDCTLSRSRAGQPSELRAEQLDWAEFKRLVADLQAERPIFRGQCEPKRLRTSYHRHGRAEMTRFVNEDMPRLHKNLSARTRHVFNLSVPDEVGAFLNLVQHHGYPTPLLDWTYSPYVAAFFAYRGTTNRIAGSSDGDKKVRIFIFDADKWKKQFESRLQLIYPRLHITIAEFAAIENERLIPQQAVTMLTNVDDIETYIGQRGSAVEHTFLRAVDLPLSERRDVVRELNYMGITAGSMFPGFDGACEALKEISFDF